MILSLYIDPAVATTLISSIGGVVIAVGAVLAIWWRKAKKKVATTLHLDENAHKEVEGELQLNDADSVTDQASDASTPEEKSAESSAQTSENNPAEAGDSDKSAG